LSRLAPVAAGTSTPEMTLSTSPSSLNLLGM
jgi:hypothetical protein